MKIADTIILITSLYLTLFLATIFYSWSISIKRNHDEIKRTGTYIWRCTICAHLYIDSKHKELSPCPRCGSYNRKSEDDSSPSY